MERARPCIRPRRRELIRALAAAPLALAAAPLLAAPAPPVPGGRLELPDMPLIEGGTFKAYEAEGKVVVVYWWASWCPFCAEMTPHVEKLWREHRDRGLVVLGIAIDERIEAPREYRRRRGYTFPSAIHDPRAERALTRPRSVPVTWVRDRQGRLVLSEAGQLFPEDVAELARFL